MVCSEVGPRKPPAPPELDVGAGVALEVGDCLEQFFEPDPADLIGEVDTRTCVVAGAECQVPQRGGSGEVEFRGGGVVDGVVVVGRAVGHQHH